MADDNDKTVNEPIRGDVPYEKADEGEERSNHGRGLFPGDGKVHPTIDWRTKEYRENMPKLEDHHVEIRTALANGETRRAIHTRIGVSRSTLDRYIADNEDLKAAWEDAQEDLLDLNEEIISEISTMDCSMIETENGTFARIDGRSLATKFNAAKLRLERLGGKRGWNQKIETNEVGNGGGRVPVICVGKFTDEELAENKALVDRANQEAMKGLEGIAHG